MAWNDTTHHGMAWNDTTHHGLERHGTGDTPPTSSLPSLSLSLLSSSSSLLMSTAYRVGASTSIAAAAAAAATSRSFTLGRSPIMTSSMGSSYCTPACALPAHACRPGCSHPPVRLSMRRMQVPERVTHCHACRPAWLTWVEDLDGGWGGYVKCPACTPSLPPCMPSLPACPLCLHALPLSLHSVPARMASLPAWPPSLHALPASSLRVVSGRDLVLNAPGTAYGLQNMAHVPHIIPNKGDMGCCTVPGEGAPRVALITTASMTLLGIPLRRCPASLPSTSLSSHVTSLPCLSAPVSIPLLLVLQQQFAATSPSLCPRPFSCTLMPGSHLRTPPTAPAAAARAARRPQPQPPPPGPCRRSATAAAAGEARLLPPPPPPPPFCFRSRCRERDWEVRSTDAQLDELRSDTVATGVRSVVASRLGGLPGQGGSGGGAAREWQSGCIEPAHEHHGSVSMPMNSRYGVHTV
eukprot:360675-Chlamydomonas_euryale.AAC.11